jgi:hypothetical protein
MLRYFYDFEFEEDGTRISELKKQIAKAEKNAQKKK